MAHTVTAPLVIAKTPEGGDLYLYQGSLVPDGQSETWISDHVAGAQIAEVEDPPPAGNGQGDDTDERIVAFLDRGAEDVIADVSTLSDEDRAAAATAEEAGKNRVTVLRALTEPPAGNGQGDGDTPPQS